MGQGGQTAASDGTFFGRVSPAGVVIGALAFAAALWPSLIPRSGVVQGALAGLAFGIGYFIGFIAVEIWAWAVQPKFVARARLVRRSKMAMLFAIVPIMGALWLATAWQNDIRNVMQMEPVESTRPLLIGAVAFAVALVLLVLGRVFRLLLRLVARRVAAFLPERIALLIGFAAVLWIFWTLGTGIVSHWGLAAMDRIYAKIDAFDPPDFARPADPRRSGSAQSLVSWEGLGAKGRDRIAAGPDAAAISALSGRPAQDPLRVYVGLNNAPDPAARADLALREMLRVGAFDRSVLVITFPTGTGWVDPAAMAPLEYLLDGDVATVGVQYSYLPSWLSLLAEPEYGAETARAVFQKVYGHWTEMPKDRRPKLYLFGLSLGAMNGDLAADFYDILTDPYQGALWAGPPFTTRSFLNVVAGRNAGTPVWAPRFRDGRIIRFTSQKDTTDLAEAPWGAVRIVYLQYASDPIVMFRAESFWRRPDWVQIPRGPDVSPSLTWVPGVSGLQLVFDMMTATSTPVGHGHVYAAKDYLAGWRAVLGETGWEGQSLLDLQSALAKQGL
ncbi:alpha/beta hydrolase [Gemmobacter serpentinus]|uniref:alpha/beta hydrolase n=1 Tax=Gemmobacter serpentinus TaxID=2652247 RepID=UPI00124D1591|nr:alpha/beta-hydrolase family protein [Gemmobacter serpentinus]